MKKIIFIALVAMFVSVETNAQFKLGVKGGLSLEDFDITGNYAVLLKKESFTSWDLGIVAQIPLVGSFHLQPEILYSSQKINLINVAISDIPVMPSPPAGTTEMSYFQVPVNLLCKVDLVAVKVFASGGAYFGYAFSRNELAEKSLKKTDWGVSLGAGVEFFKFQVGMRYNWALKNISDINDIKWKNNKFNISVAFFIL